MKTLYRIFPILVSLLVASATVGCIEDGISTSPADQPEFSTDTLSFGEQFSGEMTITRHLMVYNRHDKVMQISDIHLEGSAGGTFYLNVDGQSGQRFSNIEVRPNDSIYVLVSGRFKDVGNFHEPVMVTDRIMFVTNGVSRSVVLNAESFDVETLADPVIDTDTRWDNDRPRRITGTLTIAPGATLTIGEGTTLYFHDKARIEVGGTLVSEGTAQNPVAMRGDRLGSVVGDISFDLMASQWQGIDILPQSTGNRLQYTEIRNTVSGVTMDHADLELTNCRLRNSAGNVLLSRFSTLRAVGCEFAESASSPLVIHGGEATLSYCTFSNYYLFAAITGPLITLNHADADHADADNPDEPWAKVTVDNSILYGTSSDLNLRSLDGTDVYLTGCLLRSNGTDDDHFIGCMWGADPLFYTVRADYLFDYRLQPESPALGASTPSAAALAPPSTDFYGTSRPTPAAIGAYEQRPE
ncbi:MAG: hypothetical protein NC111_04325 [Bacteroides sp.]|nr:hypothetical protein [Bacteroides sp.]MCM1413030.1 hypothetical protein [Bacteroides sp.]MCM1471736.1 hypothetical protein [Bacteroides sp.]